ncbi:hypothetical protein Tco_0351265 [Tanacetum coccineum]
MLFLLAGGFLHVVGMLGDLGGGEGSMEEGRGRRPAKVGLGWGGRGQEGTGSGRGGLRWRNEEEGWKSCGAGAVEEVAMGGIKGEGTPGSGGIRGGGTEKGWLRKKYRVGDEGGFGGRGGEWSRGREGLDGEGGAFCRCQGAGWGEDGGWGDGRGGGERSETALVGCGIMGGGGLGSGG